MCHLFHHLRMFVLDTESRDKDNINLFISKT